MTLSRKAKILAAHHANSTLNNPLPPPIAPAGGDFSADDIFSPLDERIIAAATEALEAGQTHYVDVPGIPPLRAALADFLNSAYDSAYAAENMLVTAGAQEARFLTLQKIGELYDSVGLPAVVHPGAGKALALRRRTIVPLPVERERGYLPTLASIAAALEAGCRLLYLESPSRLSGAAYSAAEVAALAELCEAHKAAVIWDQGLAGWCADYSSLAAHTKARVAALGEAWPGLGLASWHIGYIATPSEWLPPMQSQKQIMAICTSTAAQYAALGASRIYAERHKQQLAQLRQARRRLLESAAAAQLSVVAGGAANLLALHFAAGAGAAQAQLQAAGIAAAAGGAFGAPTVLRLTVQTGAAAAIAALGGA